MRFKNTGYLVTEAKSRTAGRTDGRTDRRTDGQIDGQTDTRADGRTNGRTERVTHGNNILPNPSLKDEIDAALKSFFQSQKR